MNGWDWSADVVVVGCGYAGARAALAAHEAGAKVLILEKMAHPGGISVMSGGAVLFAEDEPEAEKYFTFLSGGRVRQEHITSFVQGLAGNLADIHRLAAVDGAEVLVRKRPGIYSYPGREGLNSLVITRVPGFQEFSWYPRVPHYNGARLMKVLLDNLEDRGITTLFSTAAKRLLKNGKEEVMGLEAETGGQAGLRVQARRAVILASGGFEFDEWAKLQYLEAQPFYSMGSLANTGDGIRMAQEAGASLWHMWHTHNSYGFKYPEFPIAFRHYIGGSLHPHEASPQVQKMPWIVVDTCGRRFMNEYPPAPQDTGARPLSFFDPNLPGYPRIPCYLIFDEEARRKRALVQPMGYPEQFPGGRIYSWSSDNSAEVEKGWIIKGETLPSLAESLGRLPGNAGRMQPAVLEETVEAWNGSVAAGEDREFRRHPETMCPIQTPPFYAMEAWPVITNTQGGPEHDTRRRVLNARGQPIPRLYTAGELGSFFGHLYELSGNIGECLASGRMAGSYAASESPWM